MLPFIAFIAAFGLNFRLIGDEIIYFQLVEDFAAQLPRPHIADYFATPPPLMFLILAVWSKIAGLTIWAARLIPAVLTYLSINIAYDLFRQKELPYPILSAFLLLFFPYVFVHGFMIYSDTFGLFFGLWGLTFYLKDSPRVRDVITGGIVFAVAIWCRQSYIAFPAGLFVYEIVHLARHFSRERLTARLPLILSTAIPLLAFLPLMLVWGGFTPPSHQTVKTLTFLPLRTNYIFVFIGAMFLPFLDPARTWRIFRTRYWLWVVFGLMIVAYFAFPPFYDEIDQDFAIAGLTMHTIDVIRHQTLPAAGNVIQFGAWLVGTAIILRELADTPWDALKGQMLGILLVFAVLITLTPRTTDRYFMQALPPLILILHRPFKHKRVMTAWLVILILLSVGFAVWQIGFKSFAAWDSFP